MNTVNRAIQWSAPNDLERVIEPLANYICAAERPKSALMAALAFLVREVDATNQAAATHFRTFLER
jgi:hypothetical protein